MASIGLALILTLAAAAAPQTQIPAGRCVKHDLTLDEVMDLEIRNDFGNLSLAASVMDRLSVSVTNHADEAVTLVIAISPGLLTVAIVPPVPRRRRLLARAWDRLCARPGRPAEASGPVDLALLIPPAVLGNLDVRLGRGDLDVTGTFAGPRAAARRAVLRTDVGRVSVLGLNAGAGHHVWIERGDAHLNDLVGVLNVEVVGGGVFARHVDGGVRALVTAGAAIIEHVDGPARVEGHVAPLTVRFVTGEVYARTMIGDIVLANPASPAEDIETDAGTVTGARSKCEPVLGSDGPGSNRAAPSVAEFRAAALHRR